MKVIVTQKQLEQIRENASKKFSCEKCDHSWKIEKEDNHPYLCHMCGYDSAKEKHNYDELENFWKNYKKEDKEHLKEEVNSDQEKLKKYGYDIETVKQALQMLSKVSESAGEFVPLEFKLYGYQLKTLSFGKCLDLYIDVDKDDNVYNTMSNYWHDLSNQLLDIFEMLGIRDEKYFRPAYDFKFNKRPLFNITTV